jgi:membrane-associated phospholipid phosphatase
MTLTTPSMARKVERAPKALGQYSFVDYATQVYSALAGLLILFFHNATVPAWAWLCAGHAVGMILVHCLVRGSKRSHSNAALDLARHFYPILCFVWFFTESGWINRMFFKDYLDPMAIRWDQALFGFQPSILFVQSLHWVAVSELFYAAYFSYYLMIGGVAFALFLRNRRQFDHFIAVVSFVFYVCYLLFIFLPVIGPRVFFHTVNGYTLPEEFMRFAPAQAYPEYLPRGLFSQLVRWIYRVVESPGGTLPSSHVAVALCTAYFSFRYLRPIRYVHLLFAVLLCLSTVYCRYHYAVDVLTGALTTALLLPAGNWLYFRFSRPPWLETTQGVSDQLGEQRPNGL